MLRLATRLAVLTFAVITFAGCVAAQRGTTQVKYQPSDTSSRVIPALEDGHYALYKGTDVKPQLVTRLRRGDRLGFEHVGSKIIAVAGSERYEYSDGASYYWNYRGK